MARAIHEIPTLLCTLFDKSNGGVQNLWRSLERCNFFSTMYVAACFATELHYII